MEFPRYVEVERKEMLLFAAASIEAVLWRYNCGLTTLAHTKWKSKHKEAKSKDCKMVSPQKEAPLVEAWVKNGSDERAAKYNRWLVGRMKQELAEKKEALAEQVEKTDHWMGVVDGMVGPPAVPADASAEDIISDSPARNAEEAAAGHAARAASNSQRVPF